ncbi:MAG: hypothetical protein ACKOUQ_00655, partial [Aquirufa sp.]
QITGPFPQAISPCVFLLYIGDCVSCVTSVMNAKSPMYNKKTQGDMACGKGPVICYGPAVQNNVRDFIIDVAEENKIDFQRQAVSRSTGTDTDSFAYATEGVASALISLPLKYMHTTVETIAKDDMNAVIDLIYHCLLKVKGGEDWRYFN